MKKDKKKLGLLDKIFGVLAVISFLIFLVHYFVLPVKAASGSNYTLPVQPEYYNEFITPDQLITLLKSAETQYHDNWSTGNYFIQFQDYTTNGNGHVLLTVQVTTIPDTYASFSTSINPSNYDSFDFVDYPSGITCAFGSRFRYVLNMNTKQVWNHTNNPSTVAIKYGNSPTTTTLGKYTSNCICYSTKSIFINSDSDKFVIQLPGDVPVIVPTGHATEPDFNDNNNINTDGHAQQPEDPTFPIYIPPTIDTTNLESLVTSLINFVKEFADFVGECFSTFFSWLVQVIKNALQAIINEIRDLQTFLYNNFVSLFESISNGIGYIIEPISSTIIFDNIGETSLVSNIGTIENSITTFTSSFNNLSEPQTYTIPIHLEDLPSNYFGNLTTQYIDLGVINPVKNALRVFVWALTTYGLFITIVDSISNYINGGQDE